MSKGKKLSVPRELKAIQEEYGNACFEAGQVQYLIAQKTQELETLNAHIKKLNNEAHARKTLDEQKAKQEESQNVSQ